MVIINDPAAIGIKGTFGSLNRENFQS
ncbi:uncharacterized protein METZ01_LOCUS25623 [marine metagenome]|uniref:Uncharacterized protein n=1 Tax=marine metagenome TaxID=408172 RepID=A0A381Q379_9ZZZZ